MRTSKLTPLPSHLQRYVHYINNTGGVTSEQFDEDWEPIGPMVRNDLLSGGFIYEITEKDMDPPNDDTPWRKPDRLGIFLRPDLVDYSKG